MKGAAPTRFDDYYAALYGGRWPALREALRGEVAAVSLRGYYMDRASVLAAQALRLPRGGTILDACAGPGGKSLVLALSMSPGTELLCNEISPERRRRLSAVLDRHLPPDIRARVKVSGFDAAAAAARKSERDRFAAILLDAPCSSERHLIRDPRALAAWTPARPRFLARRQWALLSACFLMLRAGGSLVYATCALSEEENGGVARRLGEKYGPRVEIDPPDFAGEEAPGPGRIILPDSGGLGGSGPIYVARFKKTPSNLD
ncbi:MAG: 16S rRNA methyltransferase [Treponema sp.]|jgi:16S rRNA (cytosine1407-C5)-methyltransferase|nr:16S rRNA methyltransferase [Treponema sp.]